MRTEVAIVGGGPGGAATALFLARKGISATIVEKTAFPRFHVGESFTGSVGKLLRKAGLEDEMNRRGFPIKHGVNVWGTGGKNEFYVPVVDETDEGERNKTTTWQVRRSEFDAMMVDTALESGADMIEGSAIAPVITDGWASGIEFKTSSGTEVLESEYLVDASGQSCFLAKAGLTSDKILANYGAQIALFTHVVDADRGDGPERDNTVIVYQQPNHWAWFIPIDADTTSVGVVVPSSYFRAQGMTPQAFLEHEFRELNPELTWRLEGAKTVIEPQIVKNYSYIVEDYVGPGWLCVGDSHQFIDPVFSFGVHFALHEGWKAAEEIEKQLSSGSRDPDAFREYQDWTHGGQQVINDLVDAFWSEPFAFGYVAHQKHPDDLIDLFAGRVYGLTEPSPGLQSLRRILTKSRARKAALEEATAQPT